MSFEQAKQFAGNATIGLFGAGHLGRAIARGLLDAGWDPGRLSICHRGSQETNSELLCAGLNGHVADAQDVVRSARILLYLVRPQNYTAIGDFALPDDSLLVSFLAGVPLAKIPAAASNRVRVMTSAPDTLRRRNGIAALYPQDHSVIRELLEALGLRIVALGSEADFHAFTALGPCLPIALTCWDGLGRTADDEAILETARKEGLPDYAPILQWAHSVRPRGQGEAERDRYLAEAATP